MTSNWHLTFKSCDSTLGPILNTLDRLLIDALIGVMHFLDRNWTKLDFGAFGLTLGLLIPDKEFKINYYLIRNAETQVNLRHELHRAPELDSW